MNKWMQALLFLAAVAPGSVFPSLAWGIPPINVDKHGAAIKGYDAVAYFTIGKPVKGESRFSTEWNGARWHFSSREHLDIFTGDPEKYAPQYGGY